MIKSASPEKALKPHDARGHRDPLSIDLAQQGRGAHGAFTWGVLDRILEEGWLVIDEISGNSAGAMNAAGIASEYTKGGCDGALQSLPTQRTLVTIWTIS